MKEQNLDKQTNVNNKIALTEADSAVYLSVSRNLLRQSRMKGEQEGRISGPAWIKMGSRSIRYLKKDLDEWITSFPRCEPNKIGEV